MTIGQPIGEERRQAFWLGIASSVRLESLTYVIWLKCYETRAPSSGRIVANRTKVSILEVRNALKLRSVWKVGHSSGIIYSVLRVDGLSRFLNAWSESSSPNQT